MSAFVVNPQHIATCAKIIKDTAPEFVYVVYGDNPLTDAAIRTELALANVASVAWRYGADGQVVYAPILASITEQLTQGEKAIQVSTPKAIDDVDKACFREGYTWMQFVEDCQAAEPVSYTAAEGYQYLSCFSYQSCEPPEWKESKVYKWMLEAKAALADQLMRREIGDRHVWEVDRTA